MKLQNIFDCNTKVKKADVCWLHKHLPHWGNTWLNHPCLQVLRDMSPLSDSHIWILIYLSILLYKIAQALSQHSHTDDSQSDWGMGFDWAVYLILVLNHPSMLSHCPVGRWTRPSLKFLFLPRLPCIWLNPSYQISSQKYQHCASL